MTQVRRRPEQGDRAAGASTRNPFDRARAAAAAQVNDDIKYGMIEAISHLIHRDYEAIVQDFVTLEFIDPGVDLKPLLPVLARVFDRALEGGGAKNFNFQELAADLAQITFDFPFKIPPYFALIIRAIGVLEGIALVGNPDFALVDEAYPYISKRLLTDKSPRLRAALTYMVYGKSRVFDPDRLIDILQSYETFAEASRSARGAMGHDGAGHAGNGRRSPSQVSIADGLLTLTGDEQGNSAGMAWNPGQMYGRWEGCVQSPPGADSLHALLLLWPDAENWPVGGEVDFMEISDSSRQSVDGFLHYGADNQQEVANTKIDATQWHAWAVEWTPQHIAYYVDGKQWFETTDTSHLPPGPMHLTIQLDYFGGNASGGAKQHVDWVRQYPASGGGASPGTSTSGGNTQANDQGGQNGGTTGGQAGSGQRGSGQGGGRSQESGSSDTSSGG